MQEKRSAAWDNHRAAASMAMQKRDYQTAEVEQLAAVSEAELFDATDPRLAVSLQDLLAIYARGRKPAEPIEPLARRLLAVQETNAGLESAELIPALRALAGACWELGRSDEAEQLLRRALNISEKVTGRESPGVAGQLHGLGVHLWSRKRYAEAEAAFVRARNILTRHPAEHSGIRISAVLDCLAMLYDAWRQPAKAEEVLHARLRVADEEQDDESTKGGILGRLAAAYRDQGKYELSDHAYMDAIEHHQRWLRRTIAARRFRKPATAGTRASLRASIATFIGWLRNERADVLRHLNQVEEAARQEALAERSFRRAIAIEEARQPNGQRVADYVAGLAQLYRDRDKFEAAEPLYRRAIAIFLESSKTWPGERADPESVRDVDRTREYFKHRSEALEREYLEFRQSSGESAAASP